METVIITGHDFRNMLETALESLTQRYQEINSLNVFPVPDGDTGTNMHLTFAAAVEEGKRAPDSSSIGGIAEAVARGALMGARGNSGVILSQLLRGIAKGLKGMDRVAGLVFAQALQEGVDIAYKAIMKPVEGTILTVAREAALGAMEAAKKKQQITGILQSACRAAETTLQKTPTMLPALKEAGVVDAGGMGWLVILQGMEAALDGYEQPAADRQPAVVAKSEPAESQDSIDLKYPYCTEVLVNAGSKNAQGLKEKLEPLGDSLILVDSDGIIKVHIHTDHPGNVLETCLSYGFLMNVKVDNMNEQAAEKLRLNLPAVEDPVQNPAPEPKAFGIVSVAAGEGIKNIMQSLGVDRVIMGGQTMNPSTRELLSAVEKVNSKTVIILPNNKNIILTAKQVENLTDKDIRVIPTKSIPQGLAALLSVTAGADVEKTVRSMTDSAHNIKTGEITYAVRDTVSKGKEINKGSIIGLFNGEIVNTGSEVNEVVITLLKHMITANDEICSLYFGEMVEPEEAEALRKKLEDMFPDLEFELHSGGQPLYYYLLSVE